MSQNTLSVSVVVPVLNGARTIGDLLNALLNQSGTPLQTQIIVVDNGSTDGTQKIVRQHHVKLLEERRPGPAAARNLGLRYARGDVIAHIDADAIPSENWLSEIVAPFRRPDVVLVGGRTMPLTPLTRVEQFIAEYYPSRVSILREVVPFVSSVNMAVRRRCALGIGGWSEEMKTGEDIDFCYRLLRKFPAQIARVGGAVVFHGHRRSAEELRKQAWCYGEGLAHIFLRYPELLKRAIIRTIVLRGEIMTSLRHSTMFVSTELQEPAYYHRLWTWSFWQGFLSMFVHHAYVPPPTRDSIWTRTFVGTRPKGY